MKSRHLNRASNDYWSTLHRGTIVGIIDKIGAAHSVFVEPSSDIDPPTHYDFWPMNQHHIRWRWDSSRSLWSARFGEQWNEEDRVKIENHITRRYGIKFWNNGHHDIVHFNARLDEEETI